MAENNDKEGEKEENRIGTANLRGAPDDDWTEEYPWTRHRGPDPWPVPGGWIFKNPEGGGWWIYYGEAGIGHDFNNSIREELEEETTIEEASQRITEIRKENGERASLHVETANPDEVSRKNPEDEKLEWEFKIEETTLFKRVEPDRADLMEAVAEGLQAYHDGTLDDKKDEILPSSGKKPEKQRKQEKIERRKEQNSSLDQFT